MDNLAPKEIADEEMINQAFHELLNDYLNTKHRKKVEIITKAFNFANQAHKGIKRRSGEPYIMHPIAVASIVCSGRHREYLWSEDRPDCGRTD